jgi:alpha/beta hydrolase fold
MLLAASNRFQATAQPLRPQSTQPNRTQDMSTITTKDGTEIYFKDWGTGPVVTFSHGWPLNADAWDGQMLFLVQKGYRCVALDRRGHGRSSQASANNDMDGYADDLAAVTEALDLRDATLSAAHDASHRIARDPKLPRDRLDLLALDMELPQNPTDRLHRHHPRSLSSATRARTRAFWIKRGAVRIARRSPRKRG